MAASAAGGGRWLGFGHGGGGSWGLECLWPPPPLYIGGPSPRAGRPLPNGLGVGVWVPTQTPPLFPNLRGGVRV
jgi:hypothetical protein